MGTSFFLISDEDKEMYELGKGLWQILFKPYTLKDDINLSDIETFLRDEIGVLDYDDPPEYYRMYSKIAYDLYRWIYSKGCVELVSDYCLERYIDREYYLSVLNWEWAEDNLIIDSATKEVLLKIVESRYDYNVQDFL